ncbi:hypothetical protein E4U54_004103 [Claviceps lovelessii]|nr:hypothetical protein E4U54_004103 [Claviceps lovelessii]
MVAARPAVCLWDSVCLEMANCRWTKATSVGGFGRLLEVVDWACRLLFLETGDGRRKTEDGRRKTENGGRGTRGWSKVRAGCLPPATTDWLGGRLGLAGGQEPSRSRSSSSSSSSKNSSINSSSISSSGSQLPAAGEIGTPLLPCCYPGFAANDEWMRCDARSGRGRR